MRTSIVVGVGLLGLFGAAACSSEPADSSSGGPAQVTSDTTSATTSGVGGATTSSDATASSGTDSVTTTSGTSADSTSTGAGGGTATATTTTGSSSGGSAGATSAGETSGTTGETVTDGSLFSVTARLASELDADAPGTVGIVTWSISQGTPTAANIEFGLDTSYGSTAPVDLAETEFRTLLLGMKPSSTYHFRVTANVGTTTYVSDDYTIDTGPPTNIVSLGDYTVLDETAHERGFIVASYWQGDASSVAFVIDADGEIVWWYDTGSNGIARARMSADGKNMWLITPNNSGGPLQRVSMDTLDGQTYQDTVGSHDLTPVSGATMAYLEYGESDCDSIFEIDPSGAVEEVFESADFLTAGGGGPGGGCHGNALRYSQTEDVYTFSDVAQDILVVNRTGGVDWRISELLSGGIQAYGGRQHGHHLLDGSILVFANSWEGQNNSVVVEYDLSGQEIWSYEGGHYSANLGDVQRLPGGNTLVTYSNDSVVHEVDAAGNLVMEFDGAGSRIGYTLWRPTLYGPPPDIQQ